MLRSSRYRRERNSLKAHTTDTAVLCSVANQAIDNETLTAALITIRR